LADAPALDLIYTLTSGTAELLELFHACLDSFQPIAIQEHEDAGGWRVFFAAARQRDAALSALTATLGARLTSVAAVNVPDEDWAARSQAHLTPVDVGRIVVAPPWSAAAWSPRDPGQQLVIIQPSMGFGTGHHATTRLCLALLQEQPLLDARVIDVGTGSGVLAIAAWKLGAREVLAVDCDPDALENARENVERNGAQAAIRLENRDLRDLDSAPADIVLANLTAAALQRYARRLQAAVRDRGRLILSGFTRADLQGLERGFGRPADEVSGPSEEDGWCAALFVNRPRQT
jgi:ribosomal protein L11 methyltransferase